MVELFRLHLKGLVPSEYLSVTSGRVVAAYVHFGYLIPLQCLKIKLAAQEMRHELNICPPVLRLELLRSLRRSFEVRWSEHLFGLERINLHCPSLKFDACFAIYNTVDNNGEGPVKFYFPVTAFGKCYDLEARHDFPSASA